MRENFEPEKLKISLKPEDMVGKFRVDEMRKKDAIRETAKSRLISDLSRGHLDYVEESSLEGVDNVRSEEQDDDNYDYHSNDNDDWEWERKKRLSQIPNDIKSSIEVQQAAKEGVLASLSNGYIDRAIEIKDIFSVPPQTIYSPEILNAVQTEITRRASCEDIDGVIEVVDKLFSARSSKDALSPELGKTFRGVVVQLISSGYVKKAIEIKSKLSLGAEILASPEVQNALKKKISDYLIDSNIREAEHLKEQFSLTPEFMSSPEVQEAVKELFTHVLSDRRYRYHRIEESIEIRDKFSLSTEHTVQAATRGLVAQLFNGNAHGAIEIRDKLELPAEILASPEVLEAAKTGILLCLNNDSDDQNSVENATSIKNMFAVPVEFLSSPGAQQTTQRILIRRLSGKYMRIDDAVKIKNEFLLSDSSTHEAAKAGMIEQILRNSLYDAKKIRDAFSLPESVMHTPEVQQAAKQAIIKCLQNKHGSFGSALKIKEELSLPVEILFSLEVQEAAEKIFIDLLAEGNTQNACVVRDSFSLPTEITSSVVAQSAVKKGIAYWISQERNNRADEMRKKFTVSVEDMQQAAFEGMRACLSAGNISGVKSIQNQFHLSEEMLSSEETKQSAIKGMLKCLSDGSVDSAIEIKDKFSLPVDTVVGAVQAELIKCLSEGSASNAVKIKDRLILSPEIITSPEITQAIREGLIKLLAEGIVSDAILVKDQFLLANDVISSPEVQQSAKKGIIKQLSKGNIGDAIQIRDRFLLNADAAQDAAREGMQLLLLESRSFDNAIKIRDQFSLSKETVSQVATDAMSSLLLKGSFENAIKIKDQFQLSVDETLKAAKHAFLKCLGDEKEEMADKIKEKFRVSVNSEEILGFFPEMQKLLSDLKAISPEFSAQAEKTPDLLLNLLEFRENPNKIINIAKENPFLLDAIASNPRFGSRLLIKYPQFDKISKENIKTQCAIKKKITTEHPDIDPQTVEFRKLMQDALLGYGINKKVLESIDAKGISSERWLNYDETAYFNLGSNENTLAFSEIITTPIGRIKETIDTYAYTIKEVLNEYRTELMAFEIVLGKGELPAEELQKMADALEKAKSEGNLKKVAGIEKGIENLKAKSSQERKGMLWEKLLADVASFQRLKDDVFKAQEIFVATEKELESAVMEKMPSGKRIQDIKRKMAGAKEDLRGKFLVMERRIEEFRGNLKTMIAPALGNDRASALIQEINTKLSEQFNHFDTDRSMLKNLFSEQSDKRKEEMESRPMSIFVWTRDPDIDLYQGNYSPCCICIDSQYHGAESPIADYNVDLGIQIVNVWDEVKNEPVTAAWCWLGEDEKGETVLVVDNIEANTFYSANFSEQFTSELFKYIKNYAKEVGVKKVVLGKANNDLPTAGELSKLPEDTGRYKKIGGANRSDGYFLEAEDTNVKTIWEKGVKLQNRKVEAGNKKAERVVFSEVATYPLTEADFRLMRDLERKVYANDAELIQGLELVRDIKEGKGLEYSVATFCVPQGMTKQEMIAYAVAIEDETDEGDKSVYLEDIAVAPEAQRQGIGQKLIQKLVERLKAKAGSDGEPVLFDMHLRPNSLALLDRQREQLAEMGVALLEDVLVPDYYDEGEDAVYRVYEVSPSQYEKLTFSESL